MDREKTKVKRDNFIAVQGWMLLDLNLKGNELLIYACIYGFSQTENQWFTGSRQYLADWTNSTKQGVQKCLNSLVSKGLLEKRDRYENGVRLCDYRVTEFTNQQSLPDNKVDCTSQQSLLGVGNKVDCTSQQSLHNNIDDTICSNSRRYTTVDSSCTINKEQINPQNETSQINYTAICKDIIDYLNSVCGTNYKPNSKNTQKHIHARLNDGYDINDFYIVIDKKAKDWIGTDMEKYLCPDTLFGTKFEKYLNQRIIKPMTPKDDMEEWRELYEQAGNN